MAGKRKKNYMEILHPNEYSFQKEKERKARAAAAEQAAESSAANKEDHTGLRATLEQRMHELEKRASELKEEFKLKSEQITKELEKRKDAALETLSESAKKESEFNNAFKLRSQEIKREALPERDLVKTMKQKVQEIKSAAEAERKSAEERFPGDLLKDELSKINHKEIRQLFEASNIRVPERKTDEKAKIDQALKPLFVQESERMKVGGKIFDEEREKITALGEELTKISKERSAALGPIMKEINQIKSSLQEMKAQKEISMKDVKAPSATPENYKVLLPKHKRGIE